jgi:hypothetical protein
MGYPVLGDPEPLCIPPKRAQSPRGAHLFPALRSSPGGRGCGRRLRCAVDITQLRFGHLSRSALGGRPLIRTRMISRLAATGIMALSMIAVATSPASAASAASSTGAGTYSCGGGSGNVTFKPSWSDTGTGNVTATLHLSLSGCSGGTPTPTSVHVTGKFKFANGGDDCSGVNPGNISAQLKLTYSPKVKSSKWAGSLDTDSSNTQVQMTGYGTMSRSYPGTGSDFSSELGAMNGNCTSGLMSASFTTPSWTDG